MLNCEAIVEAIKHKGRAVIINKARKMAFLKEEDDGRFSHGIFYSDFVNDVNWMINCSLHDEGWEVLTKGKLVNNFTLDSAPWNDEYRHLSPLEAEQMLLDKGGSMIVQVRNSDSYWKGRELCSVDLRRRKSFGINNNVNEFPDFYEECRILERRGT